MTTFNWTKIYYLSKAILNYRYDRMQSLIFIHGVSVIHFDTIALFTDIFSIRRLSPKCLHAYHITIILATSPSHLIHIMGITLKNICQNFKAQSHWRLIALSSSHLVLSLEAFSVSSVYVSSYRIFSNLIRTRILSAPNFCLLFKRKC
jgi:hypothetical protein